MILRYNVAIIIFAKIIFILIYNISYVYTTFKYIQICVQNLLP